MDLSIITVTYNSAGFMPNYFEGLQSNLKSMKDSGYEYEIIFIDNASKDGTYELAVHAVADIRFIRNESNAGFAAASNQGILESKGRYVLLLNPDVKLQEENLVQALNFMERPENGSVGVLGCKVLNPDGTLQPSCYYKPTFLTEVASTLGLAHFIRIPHWTTNEIPASDFYERAEQIDSVLGAYLLFRRPVIDSAGLMDAANFFVYCEELDWNIRIRETGWSVTYSPHISVIHYGRQGIDNISAIKGIELYKSRFKLISKLYGPIPAALIRLSMEIGLILRFISLSLLSILPRKRHLLQTVRQYILPLLRWNTRTILRAPAVL